MVLFKDYVDPKPTKEMMDWFVERTNKHINLVKHYADRIHALDDIRFKDIQERVMNHDASKFRAPEFIPYIFVTWGYHMKSKGVDFEIPNEVQKMMNVATIHHITHNRHHPESHDPTFNPDTMFNSTERDSVPTTMVDGRLMDDLDLAELVADWCAVGFEKGNNPTDWADKNINKRWGFTPEQSQLIYELIGAIFH